MNKEAFKSWLDARNYSAGTTLHSLQDVAYALRLTFEGAPIPKGIKPSIRRFIGFAYETGIDQELAKKLKIHSSASAVVPDELKGLHGGRKNKNRKHEAVSIETHDWFRLIKAIEEDPTDEARILEVLAAYGMRISDALRLTEDSVERAQYADIITIVLKGDKKKQVSVAGEKALWEEIYRRMRDDKDRPQKGWEHIGEWLCPSAANLLTGSAAHRVATRLKKLSAEVGVHGRIHLHRIRRTVAVQALRIEKDITKVQQMLGHGNPTTTMRYLDEARTDEVGELQAKLRQNRINGDR